MKRRWPVLEVDLSFITGLFGGTEGAMWSAALALGVVLVLIVFGVWALKMLFAATSSVARGRNKRLAVVDQLPVDQRRQLLLVRRDNVEHLIMIGGGHDFVVETGIEPPTVTSTVTGRQARRQGGASDTVEPAMAPAPLAPKVAEVAPARPVRIAAPMVSTETPVAQNPLERLRDLGKPVSDRSAPSLRHTGLLRPAGRLEPVMTERGPQESAAQAKPQDADSVMKAAERAELTIAAVTSGSDISASSGEVEKKTETTGRADKAS